MPGDDKEPEVAPDLVVLGAQEQVAGFVAAHHWTVLSGGGLPYPVAMSIGRFSGGLRCTGLLLGIPGDDGPRAANMTIDMAPDPDAFRAKLTELKALAEAGSREQESAKAKPPVIAVTSASLRKLKIPELLEAIAAAARALSDGRTILAENLEDFAGLGYDPGDWESDDGGKTYKLPPPISIRGPAEGSEFLDQLYPGMVPDLPPSAGPRVRGKAHSRDFFLTVAAEYKRACTPGEFRAPMKELCRRLSLAFRESSPIPEPTVRRWVQQARDMKLLGPSRPGIAGEYPEDTAEGSL
jgi:hypothetical protein